MSEIDNTKRCQCGAVVADKFCGYCNADNRTNFQRNTDAVVQGVTKVGGQIADGAKTAVKTLVIFWTIVAIIVIAAITGIVIIIVIIVNNIPSNIGLLNVVANFVVSSINFLHV